MATIDGTAGSADWYRSPVTVTLTATDSGSGVESIHVQVDGGGWSLYQSPVTISSEGRHTVEYYARDVAGNEGAVQSLALGIDTLPPTTAPTVSGTLGGDGWYRSSVTVTLTSADSGSGVAGLRVRTDGSAWVSYTSPLTVAGDGPHVLEYQASDVAGNEEAIASTSFQIDTQAPITTYALSGTLSASGWYHSLVSVTLSATAGNGNPASVSYRLDNGPWTAYSGPFSVDEGRHVLQYQATDSQGTAEPVQSVPIGIDYTPPTIGQAASGTIRPEDDLTWIGFDSVSGIVRYEISVDGGAFLSLGSEARLAGPWTVGTHTAEVRAYDAAGNMATHSIDFEADPNAAAPNQPAVPTIPFNLPPTSTLLVVITLLFVAAGALLYRSARKDRASSRVRERRRRAMAPERWQPDWSDESLDETESFL